MVHAELAGDFRETPMVAVRGDADQLKPVPLRGDDPEGAFSDGAGSAEQDDASFLGGGNHWRDPVRFAVGEGTPSPARSGVRALPQSESSRTQCITPEIGK